MSDKVHPYYANAAAAATAATWPTANMTPADYVDKATDHSADTYTGTVPASPYKIIIPRPLSQASITCTVGGASRTVVESATPTAAQVGVDPQTGTITFNSADTGGSYSIGATPLATVVASSDLHRIEAQLVQTQTRAAAGPSAGTSTDRGLATWNGTTGKILYSNTSTLAADQTLTISNRVRSIGFLATTNGSLSECAFRWRDDEDNGAYRTGTNAWSLVAGGVAVWSFTTAGPSTALQITSTLATGTAPFSVASTTVVGNLNVSQLLGATWAAPAAIGSGTPAAGTFTTLAASDGAAATPSVSFATDTDTGFYLAASNTLGVTAGGTAVIRQTSTQTTLYSLATVQLSTTSRSSPLTSVSRRIYGSNGVGLNGFGARDSWAIETSAEGSIQTAGYLDCILTDATDATGYSTFKFYTSMGVASWAPAERLSINNLSVTSTVPFLAPAGTVGAPSIGFAGDTDNGLYLIGTNNVGLACAGAKVLDVGTTGLAVTGKCAAVVTVWRDLPTVAWARLGSVAAPTSYGPDYWTIEADAVVAAFPVPYQPGTIISQVRVKFGSIETADGVKMKLVKRLDSTAAATTWTTVGAEQTYTGTSGDQVQTYNVADETMADGTSYAIIVTSVISADTVNLYSVGIETTERRV